MVDMDTPEFEGTNRARTNMNEASFAQKCEPRLGCARRWIFAPSSWMHVPLSHSARMYLSSNLCVQLQAQ